MRECLVVQINKMKKDNMLCTLQSKLEQCLEELELMNAGHNHIVAAHTNTVVRLVLPVLPVQREQVDRRELRLAFSVHQCVDNGPNCPRD